MCKPFFALRDKFFFLLIALLLFNAPVFAQELLTVKGSVTDSVDNGPLPAVSVRINGTATGTKTDAAGRYSIQGKPGSVLVFTYIGYKEKRITIAEQTTLNIKLAQAATALNQVVVIGYGTTTKKDLTGAVASIDNTKFETLPNTNALQALRGGTAGVSISATGRAGSGSAVQVRGGSRSIAANNNALIVVDGIIYRGSLSDINPADIASFEVLKDASSAAIFGSQAANGVVLITTKKGKNGKPTIQFNAYAGTQGFVENQELENPEQYRNKLFNSANTTFYRTTAGQIPGVARKPVYDDVNTYFLNPTEIAQFNKGISQEAFDVVSQRAPLQSYNLSVSAKTDQSSYFISGEYTDQKGIIKGDQFKRASARVNLETNVTEWLKLGTNSFFAFNDNSGNPADLLQAARLSPYAKYYLDAPANTLKPNPVDDGFIANPLFPLLNRSTINRNNLFAILFAEINIPFVKGLSYRFNYSNNSRWDKNWGFTPSYKVPNSGLLREASASQSNSTATDVYLENLVKYNRTFGDHNIDATLLYNYNVAKDNGTTASANTFPNDALTYYSLSLGTSQTASATFSDYRAVASMARVTYKYKDRYLITGTVRRDGASVFGANNKFATFPSVAVSWLASEESFGKKIAFADLLKLRLSYGANGNQIGRYATLSPISNSAPLNYIFGDATAASIGIGRTILGNPDLKWESTYTANAGIDFELFKSRISGTIDYFNSNSKDLLLPRLIPALNGFSTQIQNIGEVNNKGIEFTLNTVNVRTTNLQWSTGINFSAYKNKIVSLQGIDNNKDGIEDDDIANSRFIGKPLNAIYNYQIEGVWQQNQVAEAKVYNMRPGDLRLRDINGDNKITPADDRTIIGYDRPDFLYGFNTTLNYKGFSLYTLLTGSYGGERNNNAILDPTANLIVKARGANVDWWTPDNASNVHPSIDYGNTLGVTQTEKTSFLRVQDISLSYNFSKIITERLKLGSLKVYVSAKNPFLFTNWSGWDPEIPSGLNQFPLIRSVTGGLSLSL